ncbi:MAG: hypothetical protein HJJLKODD_01092 [Phycisphaerae bacterium]|nr:hypothetical protein [Phycisphaerae bacterium]
MSYSALSALRRADQIFYEFLAEKEPLEFGLAFHCAEFPWATEYHMLREVTVRSPEQIVAAGREADDYYRQLDLKCGGWAGSVDQEDHILAEHLIGQGFQQQVWRVWQMGDWPTHSAHPQLRIVPARAMRRGYRKLWPDEPAADLAERQMDFPQYDMMVGVIEQQVVARGGLQQTGEIGCLRDLWVGELWRRQGIGRSILVFLMEMARRLSLRIVVTRSLQDDILARHFLTSAGLVEQGELIEYLASPAGIVIEQHRA